MEILFSILVMVISLAMAIGVPTSIGFLITSLFQKEALDKKKFRRLSGLFFGIPVIAYILAMSGRYIYLNI